MVSMEGFLYGIHSLYKEFACGLILHELATGSSGPQGCPGHDVLRQSTLVAGIRGFGRYMMVGVWNLSVEMAIWRAIRC
jgi:hypothetical protein